MTPIRLMRYHDGELPRAANQRAARELAGDPELQQELAAHRALGELVRDWAEHRSLPHVDLVDDVMRAVEQRPYSRRVPRKPASRALTWLSLGLGLAAGIALLVRTLSPVHGAARAPSLPSSGHGSSVAIESVDFGAHGGTVFMVSTTSSDTPVVWTDDDETSDEPERNEAL